MALMAANCGEIEAAEQAPGEMTLGLAFWMHGEHDDHMVIRARRPRQAGHFCGNRLSTLLQVLD
jgi:hypothetical protein